METQETADKRIVEKGKFYINEWEKDGYTTPLFPLEHLEPPDGISGDFIRVYPDGIRHNPFPKLRKDEIQDQDKE